MSTQKHELKKILEDLQEGAKAFKQLQSEVDFLVEQSGRTAQGQTVLEKFSNLWRERLGTYDPDLGIIGITDVGGDMTGVVGGGADESGSDSAPPSGPALGLGGKPVDTGTAAVDKLERIATIVNE